MRRQFTTLGALLLAFSLVMAGCQPQGPSIPSDPIEAVKVIADKQKEIKTQHLELSADLTLKMSGLPSDDPTAAFLNNFEASATAAGDIDNEKQNLSLKGSADLGILNAFLSPTGDELTFEVVIVDGTMYARAADQDWSETPVDQAAAGGQTPADLTDLSDLLKRVATAEKLGDEAIDGVDSYHYKVKLNMIDLLEEIAARSAEAVPAADLQQAQDLLQNSTVDLELWIGKSDLFIRQQRITVNLDLKNIPDMPAEATILVDLSLTTKTSKINEPVTINAPN
jgi:hypothetical protein